jgi:hypothetical protein
MTLFGAYQCDDTAARHLLQSRFVFTFPLQAEVLPVLASLQGDDSHGISSSSRSSSSSSSKMLSLYRSLSSTQAAATRRRSPKAVATATAAHQEAATAVNHKLSCMGFDTGWLSLWIYVCVALVSGGMHMP